VAHDLLRRCFVCAAEFSEDAHERGKVSVDPARGRLWMVCTSCGAWNLVPIEARWEAIEEFERIARDHGRLLAKTDNVSLTQAPHLEIVRIGKTQRREEAWWRFLKEAERRTENAGKAVRRGRWSDALWTLVLFGIPLPHIKSADKHVEDARNHHFGYKLFTATIPCDTCGNEDQQLDFADEISIRSETGALRTRARCWKCVVHGGAGGFELVGVPAERLTQRMLAFHNFAGGEWQQLNDAVHLIDDAADAARYVQDLTARPVLINKLRKAELLALEMALSESRERSLLEMQMQELEERWKQEEELAFIIDRELTPP
jgi:hypothetical protein